MPVQKLNKILNELSEIKFDAQKLSPAELGGVLSQLTSINTVVNGHRKKLEPLIKKLILKK